MSRYISSFPFIILPCLNQFFLKCLIQITPTSGAGAGAHPNGVSISANYSVKTNTGEVPPFSTEPGDLEELAQKNLSPGGW